MFTFNHIRKWALILAIPLMSITSIARADDTERLQILAAIDAVTAKIEATKQQMTEISAEIPKIQDEIDQYYKLYKETKKEEYVKAAESAAAKLMAKERAFVKLEELLNEYYTILAELEARLEELGG
ncbi:MAG: hypothetical protein H6819_01525 [Phycisphaerales bacterium]|nr:hypothetical protein [Phycisphaerales bacterium]MCB9857111.1 hypothetical protein [Phycisphaerales bacterium]MCB9861762.1 hypothetical protein [Phycisphaerales bacterium]